MRTPYKFQVEDAERIEAMSGRCLLSSEMGTGKGLISLLWARNHPEHRPVIIVCPASLKWNWRHEIHIGIGERSEILEGRKPKKRIGESPFLIINYDILKYWLEFLIDAEPKLLIADEIHVVSNRTAQRSRALKHLSEKIPYMIGLSGTPLMNRPVELWHPLHCLFPKLFPSFFTFAMRFCSPKKSIFGNGWDFRGASHLDELHGLLKSHSIRRLKKDVLSELPEKQRTIIPMTIPRKEYDNVLEDFLGWLTVNNPDKVHKARKAERLVQMGLLKRLAGELKLPLVMEWLDNFLKTSAEKILVFAIHRKIIAALQDRYKNICVVVDGSTSGKNRELAVTKFQSNSKTRMFIGNIKAAGVGLNLTAASTVAFVEIGWSPGGMMQAEDRAHRIGTKKSVNVYYLVAKDTIEHRLIYLLQSKQKVLSSTLDGGKGEDFDLFDLLEKQLRKPISHGKEYNHEH